MNIVQKLNSTGISLNSYSEGNHKTYCPKCRHSRKVKNSRDLPLSVTIDGDGAVWNCHNCDEFKGSTMEGRRVFDYQTEEIGTELEKFFKPRQISNETLYKFGVTFQGGKINFPFYQKGLVYNIKRRTLDKKFSQEKDATQIFYNVDALQNKKVIICEGEIDALSFYEAGFNNVVSLPSGAGALDACIKNSIKELEDIEWFIIATDGDDKGIKARDELSKRLDPMRCGFIEYPDGCKDANDVLSKFGVRKLQEVVDSQKPFPVEGLHKFTDYDTFPALLRDGMSYGLTTGFPNLDTSFEAQILIKKNKLMTLTGYPGSGKSEFAECLMLNMIRIHKWKFAIFSPEHDIEMLTARLVEKAYKKPFDEFRKLPDAMDKIKKLQQNITIMDGLFSADHTVEWIEEKIKACVLREGIDGFVLDPFNELESGKKNGESESEYIGAVIRRMKRLARLYGLFVIIVAHPKKPNYTGKSDEEEIAIPTMYDISGSANWFNKSDYGVIMHRMGDQNLLRVAKIKDRYIGKKGDSMFNFDVNTSTLIGA